MPKKSRGNGQLAELLEAGEIDSSMIISVTHDGERIYAHPFESDLIALEFLEVMAVSLRNDILETALKRSVN